ncbi:hypothetical protein [Chryseobacterium sp. StRB126]|uniref:hypothetical protein n=1 Tax=Chryseobacterium sp. StRB126 TaxID=878220 RepID=UPI0005ED9EA1|nr:hypothetical protein [Chryseobacterium sp. StRB126]
MKEIKYRNSGILLIDKDSVFIKFGDENITFYNNFLEEKFKLNTNRSTTHIIKSYDKKIIVFDGNRSTIYDEEGVKLGEDSNYYLSCNFNYEVFIPEDEEKIVINKKDKLITFPYVYGEKIFSQDYYIQVHPDEKFLRNYSLDSGAEIWTKEFTEFLDAPATECQRELVKYKSHLYFIVHSEGVTKCICLDIPTGNVIKEYPGLYGQMILEGANLYFLSPDHISILNTEKQEVTTYAITDVFETTEIKRLLFPRWVVKNGIIYFTQSGGADMHAGIRGAVFGALDTENLKILWYESLPKEHGIIGTIQVENERIYLHTQDNTLFIYEKE